VNTLKRLVICVMLLAFPASSLTALRHTQVGTLCHCPFPGSGLAVVMVHHEEDACADLLSGLPRHDENSRSDEDRVPHPCHNDRSSCPSAPHSGNCTICTLAQSLCPLPVVSYLDSSGCLVDHVRDTFPLYTSPFGGRMIRPPRAC
jgi:hypothetical protein